jgi:hypothetical protein
MNIIHDQRIGHLQKKRQQKESTNGRSAIPGPLEETAYVPTVCM